MSIWPSVTMHATDLHIDTTMVHLSVCSEPFYMSCPFHLLSSVITHHLVSLLCKLGTHFSTADLTCLQKNHTFAHYWNSMTSSGNTLLHVWKQHRNMSQSLSPCFIDSVVWPCKLHPYHFNRKCTYLNMTECRKLLDPSLYVFPYCYCKADCSDIFNISKKCAITMGQTQNIYPTNIPAPLVHSHAPVTCIKSGLTQCTIIFIAYSLIMQSNCHCM
jgi:hypothetical protein